MVMDWFDDKFGDISLTKERRRMLSADEQALADETQEEFGINADDIIPEMVIGIISIAVCFILILIFLCLLKTFYHCLPQCIKNLLVKIKNMLMFNSVLRYVLTAYQSMMMNAFVTLHMLNSAEPPDYITLVSALLYILALLGFLAFQMVFLRRNKANLNKPDFQSKFNSLYLDVITNRDGSAFKSFLPLLFTTSHCLRRIIFPLAIVFLDNMFYKIVLIAAIT